MRVKQGENTIEVETEAGETLYYAPKYLETVKMKTPLVPVFWRQCPVGRIIKGVYALWHTPEGKAETTTLTGYWPKGTFEVLRLEAGEAAYVSLRHLAGFVVRQGQVGVNGVVMRPVYRGLVSPAAWIMGSPVPCVFQGPVSVVFYGQALRWDDRPGVKELKVGQVVSFDVSRGFEVRAMDSSPNPMSVLFNALTLESRFVQDGGAVLKENFFGESGGAWRLLKHFVLHMVFFVLWVIVLWLGS